jgi:signal peptidase I
MSRRAGHGRVELAPREAAFDVLRENLEAFAVAIVMALMIKHFCLEAFRIPTDSMVPTLYGEFSAKDHNEDRILVDKWAYLVNGPERGDVMVFRYPLNLTRNFIKRVAGMPGEWFRLRHGDIWTSASEKGPWRVATKRRRVREQLYRAVYPPAHEPPGPTGEASRAAGWWTADERGDAWRVESHERLEFDGGAPARLTYARKILAENSDEARDVRLRMRVTAQGPGALALSWSPLGSWRTAVRLVCGTSGGDASSLAFAEGERETRSLALDVVLSAGKPADLEWEVVDGEVHLHVDGVERTVEPFEPPDEETSSGGQALALTASGAPLTLDGLRIERDLAYTQGSSEHRHDLGTGFRIPDDSYFMLGDNTTSSSDSRAWQSEGKALKDGREVWWNVSGNDRTYPAQVPGTSRWHVVDLDGVERWWDEADEVRPDPERRWVSFVPRANVIGRAFYIFWPAFPEFPHRLRWIH